MKKLIVLLLALAMIVSVKAALPSGTFDAGWGSCTQGGGYGGWDQDPNTCHVAWDVGCNVADRDATFSVGGAGMTTTVIHILHLDGASDDGFQVLDGSNVLCTYVDSTSSETWMTLTCDVNLDGVKTLTLHTTGAAGPYCVGYGQVAVSSITYDATTTSIPEFGLIAGVVALVGLVAGVVILRRK